MGKYFSCGYSSVVERHLAKVNVARSNRVTRFFTALVQTIGIEARFLSQGLNRPSRTLSPKTSGKIRESPKPIDLCRLHQ